MLLRLRKYLLDIFIVLCITAGLLFFLEGAISLYYAFSTISTHANSGNPIIERQDTRYDAELGWINIPDFYRSDLYGTGGYFQSNAQSFRNDHNIARRIPEGMHRIICSGDSFTMGVGVSNEDTWCHLLSLRRAQLETVNMGQGGYGVDQAFLWYMRDGRKFEHDGHIFSFITDDFQRMLRDDFFGYGKPVLRLNSDGTLVTTNTPVPRASYVLPWVTQNRDHLKELKLFRLPFEYFARQAQSTQPIMLHEDSIKPLLTTIFENLRQVNVRKKSRLLVVYLPTQDDYEGQGSDGYRAFLSSTLSEMGVAYLDLVSAVKTLPREGIPSLYLTGIGYGHFTPKGNQWVANEIFKKMASLLDWELTEVPRPQDSGARPWAVEYYKGTNLEGAPVVDGEDFAIDHHWGIEAPNPEVPTNHFSARWSGCLQLAEKTRFKFYLGSDDGSRLLIDGSLLIDNWGFHAFTTKSAEILLAPGPHVVQVEYFEFADQAEISLRASVNQARPTFLTAPLVTKPPKTQPWECSL